MMQIFKIIPGAEKTVAWESVKRPFIAVFIMTLFFLSIPIIRSLNNNTVSKFDQMNISALIIIPAVLFYYLFSCIVLIYRIKTISIDDSGIEQRFDVGEQALSFGELILMRLNKKIFQGTYLRWDEIVNAEYVGNSLVLKNKNGVNRKQKGIISIPKKLENFKVAEGLIKKHVKGLIT